jgi:hypothetical protein
MNGVQIGAPMERLDFEKFHLDRFPQNRISENELTDCPQSFSRQKSCAGTFSASPRL